MLLARRLPFIASSLALCACSVVRPPGYPEHDEQGVLVQATPGKSYGVAPTSWDLPNGERIRINVLRADVTSGMGMYAADIAFTAALGAETIHCESEPTSAGIPPTRFGCWSIGGSEKLTFWLAPGEDCPPKHVEHVKTLTTPACWHGQASVNGETMLLRHGYLKSTGSPVGYISWLSATNEPLLAADIVLETSVRLYEPKRDLTAALKRNLTLLTIALAWWEDASKPS